VVPVTVLDDIVAGVREDLATRRAAVPDAEIRRLAAAAPAGPSALAALADPTRLSLISEVKRRSPSKGALADIPVPADLAGAYERGGAAVISVLTEQRRFGGSLADLDAVRAEVSIPVLRKDFVVDEYQIHEARAHGADLVLLIVASLSDAQLAEHHALVEELGMHALVEVHTGDELDRALAAGARILGVNARNLKTLDVHPEVVRDLLGRVPDGVVRVAESGVTSAADVADYAAAGADAALVGEALVTGADPAARAAEFIAAGTAAITARQEA
jgi:indole-3-glycerol phosphate synthase